MVVEAFDRGAGQKIERSGMKRGQRQTLRKDKRDQEDRLFSSGLPEEVQGSVKTLKTPPASRAILLQSAREARLPVHAVEDLLHR